MEKTIHSAGYKVVRGFVEMRRSCGLTQRDLATLLKVQHSWVGKTETGERRIDIVEYCRICKAMEVDPHEGLELCVKVVI